MRSCKLRCLALSGTTPARAAMWNEGDVRQAVQNPRS